MQRAVASDFKLFPRVCIASVLGAVSDDMKIPSMTDKRQFRMINFAILHVLSDSLGFPILKTPCFQRK